MTGDLINPIVVKEMRQGLKSRTFLAAFLGLQALMVLSMLIYFTAVSSPGGEMSFANGFFWTMIGLVLILVMPLRAFFAIYAELKGNTLEMIYLTRMSAWHISLGKWLALTLQVLLLVSAVLPYLVLRYFLGSINIAEDLRLVYNLVVYSLLLMAAGVGMSAWRSKLLRILIFVGAGLFGLSIGQGMMFLAFGGMGGGGTTVLTGWAFVVSLVVSLLLMVYFVEYGASVIAPAAENHALPKRLIGLAICGVFLVYAFFQAKDPIPVAIALALMIPLFIDTLCEPVPLIAGIYRRPRWMGPLRILFLPGWISGMLFTALLIAGLFTSIELMDTTGGPFAQLGISLFAALILPVGFVQLILPHIQKWTPAYIAVQLGSLVLATVLLSIDQVLPASNLHLLAACFPHAALLFVVSENTGASSGGFWTLQILSTGLILLLALVAMVRPLRAVRTLLAPPPSES